MYAAVLPHIEVFFGSTYFRTEEELTVGTRTINIIILKMYFISSTRIVNNAGFSCVYIGYLCSLRIVRSKWCVERF
jgi:hypothetical protein